MVGGGLEQFSVSPRPLGFGFGTKGFWAKGLGPGLDNFNFTSPRAQYFHPDGQRWVFIRPRHLVVISQSEAEGLLTLTNQRPALVSALIMAQDPRQSPGCPAIAECFRCPHYDTDNIFLRIFFESRSVDVCVFPVLTDCTLWPQWFSLIMI